MELKLYNFSKKPNSTAIPSDNDLVETLQVSLKREGVSKDTPIVECSNPLIRLYDYCKFDSSWYYVKDFEFDNYQRYTIFLELDVLGTYRQWIMDTPNYCVRTSVAYNGFLSDRLQPPDVRGYQLTTRTQFYDTDQDWYLINLSGKSGAKWFYITEGSLNVILQQLYSQKQSELWNVVRGLWPVESGGTVEGGSLKFPAAPGFIELAQYINALVRIPFAPNNLGASEELFWGYWQAAGVAGARVDWIAHQGAFNINVPHPAGTELDGPFAYQRFAPYCTYHAYIPGCGVLELPSALVAQVDFLNVQYYVDVLGNIYGQMIIQGQPIAHFNGNCATYIPVSQASTPSMTQGLASFARAVPSLLTGTGLGQINDIVQSATVPVSSFLQSTGGNYALGGEPSILVTCNYSKPADGFNYSKLGYPYCKVITPSANGYYLFKEAHVTAGEEWENRKIEQYMNGGIIIE